MPRRIGASLAVADVIRGSAVSAQKLLKPQLGRPRLCVYEDSVASMKVKASDGRYFVTVKGQLRGRDLRRLERACGPALEYQSPPLTVELAAPVIDAPARRYLERLAERGALVLIP